MRVARKALHHTRTWTATSFTGAAGPPAAPGLAATTARKVVDTLWGEIHPE